jgi:hypothetical protein
MAFRIQPFMAALPSATLYTNFFAGGFHESLRNFATGCRHFKALRCKLPQPKQCMQKNVVKNRAG